MELLLPSFIQKLVNPAVKNILMCGCGGGFDFVHSMNLYPMLKALGKTIYIHSYSFGDVQWIDPRAKNAWNKPSVKIIHSSLRSHNGQNYDPELNMCAFLDEQYPESAPHEIYASYARDWTVPALARFYTHLVQKHSIDAIVVFDGGSDSLMRGDESGLGDPIEDAVSVMAVNLTKAALVAEEDETNGEEMEKDSTATASSTTNGGFSISSNNTNTNAKFLSNHSKQSTSNLHESPRSNNNKMLVEKRKPLEKLLCAVGLGSDRYNDVSDAASLRAIAEITRAGGFRGSLSLESTSAGLVFYSKCLAFIYARQSFRSVLSGVIVASSWGHHAFDVPTDEQAVKPLNSDHPGMFRFPVGLQRIKQGECFLWPLMAHIWAFDIAIVAKRSWICQWIADAETVDAMYEILNRQRKQLQSSGKLRDIENLPTHESMRG